LTVLHFDFGLRPPGEQAGNSEATEYEWVGEVQRRHLGGNLQPNAAAAGDGGCEPQANPELLENDRDGVVSTGTLNRWVRELSARQEGSLAARQRNEVWLSQALQQPLGDECPDENLDASRRVEES